jgi:hypothetical protein
MKSKIGAALKWIGIILFAGFALWGIIIRFQNPDMTEMRLFFTYWWQWPLTILWVAIILIGEKMRES